MQNNNLTGYFGPGTVTWSVYREPILMLGSYRALLLQIANPAVAEGVAHFSNFKQDALGRGFRTFRAMATIYFGTVGEADEVGRKLNRVHDSIKGQYRDASGSLVQYEANQADLKLWVLATLVDTALFIFEKVPIRGMAPGWEAQFYEESKEVAAVMGIPAEKYPADLAAFRAYFDDMLQNPILGSSPVSRELTDSIVHHFRILQGPARLFASAWLPAPLCERLGLPDAVRSEKKMNRLLPVIRFMYKLLPAPIRFAPAYHQAMFRIAKVTGQPTAVLGRVFNWLALRAYLPFGLPVRRQT
jgi:uncharacterized protein (DUF2236 family)